MTNTHKRGIQLLLFVAALVLLGSCGTSKEQGDSQGNSIYLPKSHDTTLIFTHEFKPDDYKEGKRIVVNEFSDAIEKSGATRRTYFLSRPENSEVVVISFFQKDSDVKEWLNSDERKKVLSDLKPLYREPLKVQQYHVDYIHNT